MPRRRSFRRRGGFRRARRFIRRTVAQMGPLEAKRILFHRLAIGDSDTAQQFDGTDTASRYSFIVAQESVDEEVESNGTTIAEVRPYSKVVGIKTNFIVHGLSTSDTLRWMVVKDVDGERGVSNLSVFHNSDDTQAARELRANTLAKGYMVGSDRTSARLPIFIKRSTLKRLGGLRENDKISLYLQAGGTSTSSLLTGFGTVYVRHN